MQTSRLNIQLNNIKKNDLEDLSDEVKQEELVINVIKPKNEDKLEVVKSHPKINPALSDNKLTGEASIDLLKSDILSQGNTLSIPNSTWRASQSQLTKKRVTLPSSELTKNLDIIPDLKQQTSIINNIDLKMNKNQGFIDRAKTNKCKTRRELHLKYLERLANSRKSDRSKDRRSKTKENSLSGNWSSNLGRWK